MTLIHMDKPVRDEILLKVQDFLNLVSNTVFPVRIIAGTIAKEPPDSVDRKLSERDFENIGHAYLYFRTTYPVGNFIIWMLDSEEKVLAVSTNRFEKALEAVTASNARHKFAHG